MYRIVTLASCLTAFVGGPLWAESAFDLVFRSGTLDTLLEGTELHYEAEGLGGQRDQGAWRQVVVDLESSQTVSLWRHEDGDIAEARPLGSFDPDIGNPVAMMFLEQTVNRVSEATGGSPYYIRNRIREALGAQGEVETVRASWDGTGVAATEVALRPFADDDHRSQLGRFADLEIRVVVSEAVPGWYLSMTAEAPATGRDGAYAASLLLTRVEP